ncbi:MAG: DMT family protein [Chthoniobacterales bacterium]
MKTVILLVISNTFMNLAWYGHLKWRSEPLWLVVLLSWGLAFFEYLFQVPANRIGSNEWSVPQLKILQEGITLVVFTVVAFVLFRTPLKWNFCVSYGLICAAVFFAFKF